MKKRLHPITLAVLFLTISTQQSWAQNTAAIEADSAQIEDAQISEAQQLKHTLKNTVQNVKDFFSRKKNQDQGQPEILTPKYPVDIQVDDKEIKAMLEQFLPILVYQRKEVLDQEQVAFLAEDTPKKAQEMIRTEGYFNAQINMIPRGHGYVLKVILGKRTHIDNVSVALLGDILSDDDLSLYYKQSFANWGLPVGAPFRQEGWTQSKASVLSAVTRKKYPLAVLSHTQATINPDSKKADLTVNVDSKRPIYFGEKKISGNERYPVSVIRGLAEFQAGDVYDLDKILDYQQALEQDSHYSGASVQADFENLQGDRVPVIVSVSEVKRQKVEAGLRYDSQYGIGANIGYDHYNLFGRGYIGSIYANYDRFQTTLATGLSQPRKVDGYHLTSNLAYNRSTTQRLEKHSMSAGLWYVKNKKDTETRYGIEFIGEDANIPDQKIHLGRSFATMLTAAWRQQKIETALRPANGYYIDGKIGTTVGKLLSSAAMARAKASAGYYFTPEDKTLGTFIARGEVGYVYAKHNPLNHHVPSGLMFRTGGANSIRGYELDSIGARVNGAVLPERAMAVLSAEYQYPIKKDFALALFHDMGGTGSNFKNLTLRHGSGVGVRWFSPVAPFSFDLAYGHHDRKIRWHISLGTRF